MSRLLKLDYFSYTMKFALNFCFLLGLFMSQASGAEAGNVKAYFAKVLGIDANGVIHIQRAGAVEYVKLSYVRVPSKGEYKAQEAHSVLASAITGKWVQISETGFKSRSGVKSAIIRDDKQRMINLLILSLGMAMPEPLESPPQAAWNASSIAQQEKIGLWENPDFYKLGRVANYANRYLDVLSHFEDGVKAAEEKKLELLVADTDKKEFYKLRCIEMDDIVNWELLATQYVGEGRGYRYVERCFQEDS